MTEALKKLIEAVEAGTLPEPVFQGFFGERGHWAYTTGLDLAERNQVFRAYNGSLDAAKALHEALLPGWGYMLSHASASVYGLDNNGNHTIGKHGVYEAQDDNSARAWLICILKAKLAQEGG